MLRTRLPMMSAEEAAEKLAAAAELLLVADRAIEDVANRAPSGIPSRMPTALRDPFLLPGLSVQLAELAKALEAEVSASPAFTYGGV